VALFKLSPLNQRRLQLFKNNRRGYWSFRIFMVLFVISLVAPLLCNDRPLLASYKDETLYPLLFDYPESKFGGFLAKTDFRDSVNQDEINANGWMLWPPIHYSFGTTNRELPSPAPSKPAFLLTKAEACVKYEKQADDPQCHFGNLNWLGTDDKGRDVLTRLLYGFRTSVAFGLILTLVSSMIGVAAGAVQGYFGGWTDLLFQRFIDIWSALPELYLLIILTSFITPNFWFLLLILMLFSWTRLVKVVRTEFLRARNFEYVRAARALGLGDWKIMYKHVLPNALVSTITFMPFLLSGSVTTLTSLDYLGFGLPTGSASLGEMVRQGKENLFAPWLASTAFIVISMLLILLVFIGEAVRDALDPRKTFQ
jgi:microcin C transport system permease protein